MGFNIDKNNPAIARANNQKQVDIENIPSQKIPASLLIDHPFNEKLYDIDNESILELAETIKEVGLLQPLVVRKINENQYQILAGHRRKRACIIAKVDPINAIVLDGIDDKTAEIILIVSNNHRQKTSITRSKEIKKLKELYKEKEKEEPQYLKGLSINEQIAEDLDISVSSVQRDNRLNNLIPEIQEMVSSNFLPSSTAEKLCDLSEDEQKTLFEKMKENENPISREQASKLAKDNKEIKKELEKTKKEKEELLKKVNEKNATSSKSEEKNIEVEKLKKQAEKDNQEISNLKDAIENNKKESDNKKDEEVKNLLQKLKEKEEEIKTLENKKSETLLEISETEKELILIGKNSDLLIKSIEILKEKTLSEKEKEKLEMIINNLKEI